MEKLQPSLCLSATQGAVLRCGGHPLGCLPAWGLWPLFPYLEVREERRGTFSATGGTFVQGALCYQEAGKVLKDRPLARLGQGMMEAL